MLFMIRMSVEILPLTIGWPVLWGVFALVLVAGLVAQRYLQSAAVLSPTRWTCEMAALAIGPACMLIWGRYFWLPNGGYSSYAASVMLVLDCMALASVAVAVALVWRHRMRPKLTLGVATLSLWWASGTLSVATMCIWNSWP
jgi:hypothetical protein